MPASRFPFISFFCIFRQYRSLQGCKIYCTGYLRSVSSSLHPAFPPSQRSAFGIAMLMEKANVPSPTLGSLHKGVCVCGGGGAGGCGEWSFAFVSLSFRHIS